MRSVPSLDDTAVAAGGGTRSVIREESARIELIIDGQRRPVCAPNRVLLESGQFWSGYRLEVLRIPAAGILERVSTPHHRVIFVGTGTCDVRYRAHAHEGRHRLLPGSFCFVSRGYLFDRLSWKGGRSELVMLDITEIGTDLNPIDAFGRTDALFDMYMGIADTRVATLVGLMRTEIESSCPTGSAYGEALSLALGARIASLCATMPDDPRRAATLASRQLAHVTDHIAKSLADELTIDRLATLVNMSPFHFARCFKHTTGLTPHQFVTRERIERAKAMLAQGSRPIGEIAMAVGFSSQSHFADVYRRVTGTSPRRARNHATKRR